MTTATMQTTERDGSVETTYVDGEGKLAKIRVQLFRVRGDVATPLTIDDPFYRIALKEYTDAVKAFNNLPLAVRQQYIAIVKSQMHADNGRKPDDKTPLLSKETQAEYRANILKHGFSPENPYAAIIRDHELGYKQGLYYKVYNVGGRPVDERCMSPVVVSFCMQAEAFEGGNIYATARQIAKLSESQSARPSRSAPSMN